MIYIYPLVLGSQMQLVNTNDKTTNRFLAQAAMLWAGDTTLLKVFLVQEHVSAGKLTKNMHNCRMLNLHFLELKEHGLLSRWIPGKTIFLPL